MHPPRHQSYLLDTNIILALLRGNVLGTKIDRAFGLRENLQRHVVSIVTHAELIVLADRNLWQWEKRAALDRVIDNVVVIPLDSAEIVQAYSTIAAAAHSALDGSRTLGNNDLWIAATALYIGLPLLTTDKDFRFLQDNPIQVLWMDPNTSASS